MTNSIDKEMRERVKQNAEAIAAYASGELIDVKYAGEEWREFTGTVSNILFQHDIQSLMEHIHEGAQFRPKAAPEIDEETQRAIEHYGAGNGIEVSMDYGPWAFIIPCPLEFIGWSIRHLRRGAEAGEIRCRIKPPITGPVTQTEPPERYKPSPVSRDWNRPEDVPIGCHARHKGERGWSSVIGCDLKGIYGFAIKRDGEPCIYHFKWGQLWDVEHTTDGGKTWKPCRVEEEAK